MVVIYCAFTLSKFLVFPIVYLWVTLFLADVDFMGLGLEKIVIAWETIMIIAKADALEILQEFLVFLWRLRH